MKWKWSWGLAGLIVILAMAGVFLLTQRNIDTEPKIVLSEETKNLLKEQAGQSAAQDVLKPPQPGTSLGEHWRDRAHEPLMPAEVPPEKPHVHAWSELSLEERKQLVEIFYRERGLEPPPEGYEYRWASPDVPMLDDNGEPILHPIGEPIVEIETGIGFAPTPAQYQRYKALQRQYSQHLQAGNIVEAEQIATDIALLEKEAEGKIPIIRVFLKSSGLSGQ